MYTKENLRIVFMGTPEFAVEGLKTLVDNNFNVVGVVTTPDKPAGRGQKLSESAVKQYAKTLNIPILQPDKLKDETFYSELKALNADIQIIVAFRMLPESIWSMPKLGSINIHASILPNYRGAAPINWAIINGEKESGITTFFLKHEIDTGNVLFCDRVEITPDDNAGTLHDKLMYRSGPLLLKTLDAVMSENYTETPQSEMVAPNTELKPAPKIFKEDCQIDWNDEPSRIINKIRGLSPYPAAWSLLRSQNGESVSVKIFEAKFTECNHGKTNGTIETNHKNKIDVFVNGGSISISSLQIAGKKRMNVAEFLCGFRNIDEYKFE
ncbi:MAG: methionyl-tRNA formyltransferase [Salinivirgaceae bacterium]|nr:methionyl-tRNA formyltransferase [Salinivirgaceae bacterium]